MLKDCKEGLTFLHDVIVAMTRVTFSATNQAFGDEFLVMNQNNTEHKLNEKIKKTKTTRPTARRYKLAESRLLSGTDERLREENMGDIFALIDGAAHDMIEDDSDGEAFKLIMKSLLEAKYRMYAVEDTTADPPGRLVHSVLRAFGITFEDLSERYDGTLVHGESTGHGTTEPIDRLPPEFTAAKYNDVGEEDHEIEMQVMQREMERFIEISSSDSGTSMEQEQKRRQKGLMVLRDSIGYQGRIRSNVALPKSFVVFDTSTSDSIALTIFSSVGKHVRRMNITNLDADSFAYLLEITGKPTSVPGITMLDFLINKVIAHSTHPDDTIDEDHDWRNEFCERDLGCTVDGPLKYPYEGPSTPRVATKPGGSGGGHGGSTSGSFDVTDDEISKIAKEYDGKKILRLAKYKLKPRGGLFGDDGDDGA